MSVPGAQPRAADGTPGVVCPRDRVVLRSASADPRLRYYVYWPSSAGPESPVLVAVHGVSRNAREHVRLLAERARRHGVLVMAPIFHRDIFPHYQRLGRKGVGLRSDQSLNRMLDDLGRFTGRRIGGINLFGYSGGGQFAHRYALAYPQRVVAMVITSPGWYTWPDPLRRFPHGLAPSVHLPDLRFDFERLLQIPICVLVGGRDTERDAQLRKGRRLDREQGRNRLERGRRWIRHLKREARERGLTTRFRFRELPNSSHDFVENVMHDQMDRHVFRFLFGATSKRKGVQDGFSPSPRAGG